MFHACIRIVLVDTNHPGNIGAVARAMKNMGLRDLHLVRPKFFPNADATARASGADDVLESARVHDDLETAIADRAGGGHERPSATPAVGPGRAARVRAGIGQASRIGEVAVLFGSERIGLTNVELARCNLLVTIPTDPGYSSLNLAMAVQVLAYELWLAMRPGAPRPPPRDVPLATAEEMSRLYEHIEQVLELIDFRDRTGGGHLMARIRRLFNRAQLDQNEMNILRGILTAVQSRRRPAGKAANPQVQRAGDAD